MKQIAPLSKSQYGIYVECMNKAGEVCYNNGFIYQLDGSLEDKQLCVAIETAIKSHPALFSRIELDKDDEPVQVIDLSNETWTLNLEFIEDIEQIKPFLIQPFDLHKDQLFRVRLFKDVNYFYFFIDVHHIVFDGTSMQILLDNIEKIYNNESIESEILTLNNQAIEEAEQRKTSAFEEGKAWYIQNFDCADTFSQLTPDLEEAGNEQGNITRVLDIDLDVVDLFCKENKIFKSNLFTTAYAFLLAKYNNEQESFFTTAYNGRNDKRLAHTIGMFVKTIPVYTKFTMETTVMELLRAGQEQMSNCRKHDIYSFMDFMHDVSPQFNTMFGWHGMLFNYIQLMGKPMKTTWLIDSTLNVSLYMKAFIENGKCKATAVYNVKEYSPELINQFLESYEAVINGFLSQEYLRDIRITTEKQIELLDSFNLTEKEYDDTQTIVSLFRKQVMETPDQVAVVFKDKQYTYRQVDEISDRMAACIASKGLGKEDVVSILISRSEWMAITPLGVLKAGCAYQPLDSTYPKERLNFMMQDANVRLLIADEDLCSLTDEYQGEVLLTKDLFTLPELPVPEITISPENLFIMLYTSGSTGVPKGCQLEHKNIVAFCHWYQSYYDLQVGDKIATYASFGFDASMMDTYPTLVSGATLYIIPEEIRLDLLALNDYFEKHGITHSFMTTQVGYQFATNIENHTLRHMSVGGEKLASLTPPERFSLHNLYGPTETTVLITAYTVKNKQKEIPIGKAIDNMHLYIVDAFGHRLPVGAPGELWIAGPQVSRGYLNRPEKTQEVYIDNPFDTDKKYARIYRSGDIVRYLPSGEIQFIGRRDGQVKVRGFRIELKEVESIIREYPGIKDVTVQAFDEEGGGKFIAAYIVSDKTIDIDTLNSFIMDEKPPYMVPAITMQIESIPLNQNQKVNKKALPKPEKKGTSIQESNVSMNVLETELHELIASVINNKEFGITTILGYAGMTSITAIKLAVQINKRYGVMLDSKTLVKSGTLQFIENEILRKLMNTSSSTSEEEKNIKTASITSVPLSYAQTGVYFECLKNPFSTIYNIPCLLTFPKRTDAEQLTKAIKKVVNCHPEMNVCFKTEEDRIVQTITNTSIVKIFVKTMDEQKLAIYKNEFVKPFNLQKAPLYRFEVIQTQTAVHLLMDVHHLIFDGGSVDLFIREVTDVLEG
ncbi:MAG: amino acid adenylation domain-containing protein, partial [Parabacteroides sp.]|nr:amino acid adenylation domain-containing protein [Parabacteroides sp.]